MLWLDQRHALKAFWASVRDEEGHKADCILALRPGQAETNVTFHRYTFYTPVNGP